MWPESVWVAPEQAARAQELLAQPQAGAAAEAVRQPPPPVQWKMREGGMLDVEGDTQAVRQWLEGAGIPTGALMDGPGKVVVTAGSVELDVGFSRSGRTGCVRRQAEAGPRAGHGPLTPPGGARQAGRPATCAGHWTR